MASEFNEKGTSRLAGITEEKVPSYDARDEKDSKGQDDGPFDVAHEKGIVNQDHNISKDGVRLHPQPTADPLDPLNWSSFRKHTILAIVMYLYV